MKLMNESPALSPLLPETCHYPLTPCSADAQIMSFEPISFRYKKKKDSTKERLHEVDYECVYWGVVTGGRQ